MNHSLACSNGTTNFFYLYFNLLFQNDRGANLCDSLEDGAGSSGVPKSIINLILQNFFKKANGMSPTLSRAKLIYLEL